MGLDELLISTGVDALIKLIHDKKKIELHEAGKVLDLPPQTVEDWAHVLEEQGIIKIEYQWSKVYLFWMESNPEALARDAEEAAEHKGDVEESLAVLMQKVSSRGKELEGMEKEFKEIYKLMDPNLLELSKKVSELKTLEKEADKTASEQTAQLNKMKAEMDKLSLQLQEKEEEFHLLAKGAFSLKESDFTPASLVGFEKKVKERTDSLKARLDGLEQRMADEKIRLALPEEIAQSLATAKVELQEAREMRAAIEQNMGELKGQKELLERAGLVGSKGQKAQTLKQIKQLAQQLRGMQAQSESLRQQADTINQELSGQLGNFSKLEELARALEKRDMGQELTGLIAKQSETEKRLQRINELYAQAEKASSGVSAKKVAAAADELGQVAEDIKAEKEALESEEKEVISRLNEQLEDREDMQKIRAEARRLLGPLLKEFDELKADYLRYSTEMNKANMRVNSSVSSIKKDLGERTADLEARLAKFNSALEHKSELEEVLNRLDALRKEQAKLATDVELLQKKVKVIDLRKPARGTDQKAEAERLREEMDTTRKQAEEFERKREELRDLIKKMWDQDEEGG